MCHLIGPFSGACGGVHHFVNNVESLTPAQESLEVQLQVSGCYDTSCSANQSACNEICEEYQHLLTPVCVATLCVRLLMWHGRV